MKPLLGCHVQASKASKVLAYLLLQEVEKRKISIKLTSLEKAFW
jgi:hypothetical protein